MRFSESFAWVNRPTWPRRPIYAILIEIITMLENEDLGLFRDYEEINCLYY